VLREPSWILIAAGSRTTCWRRNCSDTKKGAFTGAFQNKVGLLEIAHKGTVFLDEIGDVDLAIQGRLLKGLEESNFAAWETFGIDMWIFA